MTIPKLPLSLFRNILPGSSSAIRSLTTRAAGEDVKTALLIKQYKISTPLTEALKAIIKATVDDTATMFYHLKEGDITQEQANEELEAIKQQKINETKTAITTYTGTIVRLDPAHNIQQVPPEETAAAAPTTTNPMPTNLENMPTAEINLTGYNFGDMDDTPPVSASGVTIEHVGGSGSFF